MKGSVAELSSCSRRVVSVVSSTSRRPGSVPEGGYTRSASGHSPSRKQTDSTEGDGRSNGLCHTRTVRIHLQQSVGLVHGEGVERGMLSQRLPLEVSVMAKYDRSALSMISWS